MDVHLYSDGEHFMTIDRKTDERGTISGAQRAVLSGILSPSGNYSFELELENPAVDGQEGGLYRSDHIALPKMRWKTWGLSCARAWRGTIRSGIPTLKVVERCKLSSFVKRSLHRRWSIRANRGCQAQSVFLRPTCIYNLLGRCKTHDSVRKQGAKG